ncbi:MAG TPA: stage 0 sporulation family protein [Anaerovoracaceae bacterium]|nr:stage 0 sporulation family protein [Anaerovoracaceae bacterium]
MVKVAGVRFKKAGKIYYFDPDDLQVEKGINVIVETARGMEFGMVTSGIKEVPESEIVPPLKKIVRIADENDVAQHKENIRKKQRALELCQEKVTKHNLSMKLIDVEYTFDNSKIIFYFTADGRVDFRELVKDLAGVFKMRIELRQIGVRDEAKMVGGIGTCGKGLCCHTWLPEFEPVSIKMAKVQNLSLNPTKISGICGRLMCCLKYENDIYYELRKGMPEHGERIKTEDGMGIVFDTNILENKIKVRLVLEERTQDKPEKLSTDFYTYKKQQITRIDAKDNKDVLDDIDEALLDEIKDLLKE